MRRFRTVASGKILPLVLATVLGVGFSGCGPAAVRPNEKQSVVENKIIECIPNGDYNIPELKYDTEDPETIFLRMSGGIERPTGIQFRDINTGEMKKLYFGGRTSQKYACELIGTLK